MNRSFSAGNDAQAPVAAGKKGSRQPNGHSNQSEVFRESFPSASNFSSRQPFGSAQKRTRAGSSAIFSSLRAARSRRRPAEFSALGSRPALRWLRRWARLVAGTDALAEYVT
jgi:hypothetical protein